MEHLKDWRVAAGVAAAGGLAIACWNMCKKVQMGRAIFSKKWFSEFGVMWPGQAMCLEIEEVLFKGRSKFQDILVFKSTTYGTVLVLDGVIQCTERDECAYQEMMAHLPLFAHPKPEKVLVIGGGDGGVLREIARHPGVKEIHICELDQMVIDVAKKYLKGMSRGYDDPRVKVFVQDGFAFMEKYTNTYDVVIVDSSDPVGPADVLFKEPFYKAMAGALREGGMACTQGECMWLHQDTITEVMRFSKKHFKTVDYAHISIPTYPSGTIGALVLSKGPDAKNPARTPDAKTAAELQYYTTDLHKASFVLPAFAKRAADAALAK